MMILGFIADSWFQGLTGIWHLLTLLPWPTSYDWFRWFLFLIMGKFIWFVVNSFRPVRCPKCSSPISEHGAAGAIGAMISHH